MWSGRPVDTIAIEPDTRHAMPQKRATANSCPGAGHATNRPACGPSTMAAQGSRTTMIAAAIETADKCCRTLLDRDLGRAGCWNAPLLPTWRPA